MTTISETYERILNSALLNLDALSVTLLIRFAGGSKNYFTTFAVYKQI